MSKPYTTITCNLLNLKIAYHGVPEKAYEVFVVALHSHYLKQNLVIPGLEDHNPAGEYVYMYNYITCYNSSMHLCTCLDLDVIMDMLGNRSMRKVVTTYYEESGEPRRVSKAVVKAWEKEKFCEDDATDGSPPNYNRLK